MTLPARPMPKPTAQVAPYAEALGAEQAVLFLLAFGGAHLHIAKVPSGDSVYQKHLGDEGAKALAAVAHRLPVRVPLAKKWLAQMLHWQGRSIADIARTLRTSDVSVRNMLRDRLA